MDASIIDLRYNMKDVLSAIDRRETVNVYKRNKLIGYFIPVEKKPAMRVQDHPFFGSAADDTRPVDEIIRQLRKPRDFGGKPLWDEAKPRKKSKKPAKRK